jgi:hypothetical protein
MSLASLLLIVRAFDLVRFAWYFYDEQLLTEQLLIYTIRLSISVNRDGTIAPIGKFESSGGRCVKTKSPEK